MMQIAEMRSTHREGAIELIERAGLPTADIRAGSVARFLVALDGREIVGVVAVEIYGADALLRSLVVSPERRKTGLGAQLVDAAEQSATRERVRKMYLLTETASEFFGKRGYVLHARDEAPEAICSHPQFRSLCPASAALMSKRLPTVHIDGAATS